MRKLHDFSWLPDGRVIYSQEASEGLTVSCDFWIMRIDPLSGRILESARKITNWTGFCMAGMTATADGKHLSFLEWETKVHSYRGELTSGGKRLLRPRLFPPSENSEVVVSWMPDGKSMLLSSTRSGHPLLYKLPSDHEEPELIAGTDRVARDIQITPDGKWFLFYEVAELTPAAKEEAVMRLPIEGGKAERLCLGKRYGLILCARSLPGGCALAETTDDHQQVTIDALDPLQGRGSELVRYHIDIKDDDNWFVSMSPDGTRVAVTTGPDQAISIISLRGSETEKVRVKGWTNVGAPHWAADGKSLFAFSPSSQGRTLLRIDLQGNATPLWEMPGVYGEVGAVTSPDGRYLSVSNWTFNSNVWMIENF
jgi:Tol biopolymer transport system component